MEKQITPKKIITTVPRRLGDTIFCIPAFQLLSHIFPGAKIDVITFSSLSFEVLQYNPHLHQVFLFDTSDIHKKEDHKTTLKTMQKNYDLAIDMGDSQTSYEYISYFAADHFYCDKGKGVEQPQAEKILRCLANYFNYSSDEYTIPYTLYPQAEHIQRIEKLLANFHADLSQDTLIGLHLGCHGLAKSRTRLWKKHTHPKAWPLKYFTRLAKKIKKDRPQVKFVLTGSHTEEALGQRFCQKIPGTLNLINQTSVLESSALFSKLALFITNDTGALHVACATPVKLIALFCQQSNPLITGPYPLTPDKVLLYRKKITNISVKDVLACVRQQLGIAL